MGCTVAELKRRMSSLEFTQWVAFAQVEPFGNDYLRTASQMALLANVNRDSKKQSSPFTAADFYPGRMTQAAIEPEEKAKKTWQSANLFFGTLMKQQKKVQA